MTDRPILFSGPMVRALLEGRKTQTRRLAWQRCRTCKGRGQSWQLGSSTKHNILGTCQKCEGSGLRPTIWQKVKPGDRLWVRETFATPFRRTETSIGCIYRADGPEYLAVPEHQWGAEATWKRSIHMPRWASRLTLVVTETRMQRVQEIDGIDALAEGITPVEGLAPWRVFKRNVWDVIHKPGNQWADNPEVVALTFTVQKANIDRVAA